MAASYSIHWVELVRSYAFLVVQALLLALPAVMAFSLTLFDRSDHVYLWMGAVFLGEAALAAESAFAVVLGAHIIGACLLLVRARVARGNMNLRFGPGESISFHFTTNRQERERGDLSKFSLSKG